MQFLKTLINFIIENYNFIYYLIILYLFYVKSQSYAEVKITIYIEMTENRKNSSDCIPKFYF